MTSATVAVVVATVFVWGALSARLERADLTAPIVFVLVGVVLAASVTVDKDVETETVKLLTEVTLVWVLFSDAARVGVHELRSDAGVFGRLLGLALPLSVIAGWLLAWGLFGGFDLWLALLVGSALAPTDAALGAAVITNPAVPHRVCGILNVESGLNDGIVTPIVLVALAGAASAEGRGDQGPAQAVLALLLGTVVGVTVGALGGRVLRVARRRQWADEEFAGPAVLALALLAYAAALACDGNGFVAAFAGGIAFGRTAGRAGPKEVFYVEQSAGLASLLVWMLFGAVAVPVVVDSVSWRLVLYAVLSLTAVRMLPVALVLLGTGLGRRTALFIGWFGPRGLASVVFALMAVEELGADGDLAVAVIVTTVLLSVLAHGVTAGPLAARFGAGAPPPEAGPGRDEGAPPTTRFGSARPSR
ncbi:MAG: cation:proton antiporter [Mycobacteriales bacterium]